MKIHDIIMEDQYEAQMLDLGVTYDPDNPAPYIHATRDFVQENCGEWLRESRGHTVYRGLDERNYIGAAFTRKVRPDRVSMNSTKWAEQLQNFFLDRAGAVARRNNSAFVSGDIEVTKGYGVPFIVMPIGPFRYTWSTKMYDWWSMTRGNSLRDLLRITADLEGLAREIHNLKDRRGENSSLRMYEEMSNVVYGDDSPDHVQAVRDNLPGILAHIQKKPDRWRYIIGLLKLEGGDLYDTSIYDPSKCADLVRADEDLVEAIDSGHEIMIAADRMLYLSPTVFGEKVT